MFPHIQRGLAVVALLLATEGMAMATFNMNEHLALPRGKQDDIVQIMFEFRNYVIDENDAYKRFRKMGFTNDAALNYVELVASTRCGIIEIMA